MRQLRHSLLASANDTKAACGGLPGGGGGEAAAPPSAPQAATDPALLPRGPPSPLAASSEADRLRCPEALGLPLLLLLPLPLRAFILAA